MIKLRHGTLTLVESSPPYLVTPTKNKSRKQRVAQVILGAGYRRASSHRDFLPQLTVILSSLLTRNQRPTSSCCSCFQVEEIRPEMLSVFWAHAFLSALRCSSPEPKKKRMKDCCHGKIRNKCARSISEMSSSLAAISNAFGNCVRHMECACPFW